VVLKTVFAFVNTQVPPKSDVTEFTSGTPALTPM